MPRPFQLSIFAGGRLGGWLRILAKNRFRVAPSRIPRAIAVTLAASAAELLAASQRVCFGRQLGNAVLEADPILILGHWRSGTTLLHELLAADPRLRAPTTLQCGAASHFVVSEDVATGWLGRLLPRRRPMDDVPMGMRRPQEDEVALCSLGLPSPWWRIVFPNEPLPDPEYTTLAELPAAARRRWIEAWVGFLREVQFEHPGRLVLKNPLHSYRVPLIDEVFPAAEFIHLVRDPREVFASSLAFWRSMYDHYGLQRHRGEAACHGTTSEVLDSILALDAACTAGLDDLPGNRSIRIRYEDLVADPMATLEAIYDHFGWEGRVAARPRWRAYHEARRGHRRNDHHLDPATRRLIEEKLAGLLARDGYR